MFVAIKENGEEISLDSIDALNRAVTSGQLPASALFREKDSVQWKPINSVFKIGDDQPSISSEDSTAAAENLDNTAEGRANLDDFQLDLTFISKKVSDGDAIPFSVMQAQQNYNLSYIEANLLMGCLKYDRDVVKSLSFFKTAANLRDPIAKYNFGLMTLRGEGCSPDRDTAVGYLKGAAEQGYKPAREALVLLDVKLDDESAGVTPASNPTPKTLRSSGQLSEPLKLSEHASSTARPATESPQQPVALFISLAFMLLVIGASLMPVLKAPQSTANDTAIMPILAGAYAAITCITFFIERKACFWMVAAFLIVFGALGTFSVAALMALDLPAELQWAVTQDAAVKAVVNIVVPALLLIFLLKSRSQLNG